MGKRWAPKAGGAVLAKCESVDPSLGSACAGGAVCMRARKDRRRSECLCVACAVLAFSSATDKSTLASGIARGLDVGPCAFGGIYTY